MSLSRWQTVSQIFEAALDLPVDVRNHYVREACRGNHELEEEVTRLLAADEKAGSFLEHPALSTLAMQTRSTAAPLLLTGSVVASRFQIVRFIGQGGMGQVYEALDLELNTHLALKVLRPEIAVDPHMLSRFRRELQLTRMITHPNVCRTFDIERHAPQSGDPGSKSHNLTFFTMELLSGETLSARLRRDGRIPPADALPLALQMIDALAAAHSVRVIHRDFKPSNVLLVPGSAGRSSASQVASPLGSSNSICPAAKLRVVVTDFGLARAIATQTPNDTNESGPISLESSLTADQVLMGTLVYMAPEQFERGEVSVASDIYSLGLVLFEMITGKRPFADEIPFAEAARRLKQPAPSAASLLPSIAGAWDPAISRCLALNPKDRFENVHELAQALTVTAASGAGTPPAEKADGCTASTHGTRVSTVTSLFVRRRQYFIGAVIVVLVSLSALGLRHYLGRQNSIPFSERDWILVGDFTNQTGERRFDRIVRDLAVQSLSQSSYLNIVPRLTALEAAKRAGVRDMNVTSIDDKLGRDLCLRENYKALLSGNIFKNGSRYTIAMRIEAPGYGSASMSDTETIQSPDELFAAVDRQSARIRQALGESLSRIETNTKPLGQVTTSSLEALQRYSTALDLYGAREYARCINLAKDAVERDDNFAMAYLLLAQAYEKLGDEAESRRLYATAANRLTTVSERETHLIKAAYFSSDGSNQKAADEYQHLLDIYPDDIDSLKGYADASFWAGHPDAAVASLRRAVQLSPHDTTGHDALMTILVRTSQFSAASEEYQNAQKQKIDTTNMRFLEGLATWGNDDLTSANRYIRSLDHEPDEYWRIMYRLYIGKLLAYQGRMREAIEDFRGGLAIVDAKGWDNWKASFEYQIARAELFAGTSESAKSDVRRFATEARLVPIAGNLERAGRLLIEIGDLPSAEKCLRAIDQGDSRDPFTEMERYSLTGDVELAKGHVDSAIRSQQQSAGFVLSFEPLLGLARACDPERPECAKGAYLSYLGEKGAILRDDVSEEWVLTEMHLANVYERLGDQRRAGALLQSLDNLLSSADQSLPLLKELRSAEVTLEPKKQSPKKKGEQHDRHT